MRSAWFTLLECVPGPPFWSRFITDKAEQTRLQSKKVNSTYCPSSGCSLHSLSPLVSCECASRSVTGPNLIGGSSPQFIEIYRHKEVRGISLLFMAVDIGGGIFSVLSLLFKTEFDGLAAASYIAVIVSHSHWKYQGSPTENFQGARRCHCATILHFEPASSTKTTKSGSSDASTRHRAVPRPSNFGRTKQISKTRHRCKEQWFIACLISNRHVGLCITIGPSPIHYE